MQLVTFPTSLELNEQGHSVLYLVSNTPAPSLLDADLTIFTSRYELATYLKTATSALTCVVYNLNTKTASPLPKNLLEAL